MVGCINEKLANEGGQSLVVRGTLLASGIDLWPVIGHPICGRAIDLWPAMCDCPRVCAAMNNTVETFDQARNLLTILGPTVIDALEKATSEERQGMTISSQTFPFLSTRSCAVAACYWATAKGADVLSIVD
jgi:hypothetical protein